MKITRFGAVKRIAAFWLAVVLLAVVFPLGAFARGNTDKAFYDDLTELKWNSDLDWGNERRNAYRELCKKYPERADAHFALADALGTYYHEEAMQEVDKAIEIGEKNPEASWLVFSGAAAGELLEEAYKLKAEIYLEGYHDQVGYITWMRKALDEEEKNARKPFEGREDWGGAVKELQLVEAKRGQLDEIEQWYQAGSAGTFQTWQDRVQVNLSTDRKNASVVVSAESEWDGEYTMNVDAVFAQPLVTVLRSVDTVYFVLEKEGTLNAKTVYRYADGSVKEEVDEYSVFEGAYIDLTELCQRQKLDVPSKVEKFIANQSTQERVELRYEVRTMRAA